MATSLLALLPLLQAGVIDPDDIVIDAKSGVSGAGRAAKEAMLFTEVSEGFSAYGVGGHRHMGELDQEFSKAAGRPVLCAFTPHLIVITSYSIHYTKLYDFFYPEHKRPSMQASLRNIFRRAPLTDQDVRTLRGVIRALSTYRKRS